MSSPSLPQLPDTSGELTVTELSQLFQQTLIMAVPFVKVVGEVSEISRPSSGHIYLTIADEKSTFPVVMWRGSVKALKFPLEIGSAVLVEGRPAIYQANGKLQLIASAIYPSGVGELQQKFIELKNKLESEGLFNPKRKRQLPRFPKTIGIVSSASGAAIHDILTRLNARMPSVKKILVDVRVQGDGAADEIADAIDLLNDHAHCDLIIVGRGGGSIEDLWAFNEEKVVRAIFRSETPIISAVGHETDVTLSDLVADLRAPTPTAAAELAVPLAGELLKDVQNLEKRFNSVLDQVRLRIQSLEEFTRRLRASGEFAVTRRGLLVSQLTSRISSLEPVELLSDFRAKISAAMNQLLNITGQSLKLGEIQVTTRYDKLLLRATDLIRSNSRTQAMLVDRLAALHPQRTLERGYSITRYKGHSLRSVGEIQEDMSLEIELSDGFVRVERPRQLKIDR